MRNFQPVFSKALFLTVILLFSANKEVAQAFDGEFGFTAVFAFSQQSGKHGWGFNLNPMAAAQRAVAECGPGAEVVAYQKDGYLALVWDGKAFAYGHAQDSAQEAYDHAVASFQDIHSREPRNKKVVSSDGRIIGFN